MPPIVSWASFELTNRASIPSLLDQTKTLNISRKLCGWWKINMHVPRKLNFENREKTAIEILYFHLLVCVVSLFFKLIYIRQSKLDPVIFIFQSFMGLGPGFFNHPNLFWNLSVNDVFQLWTENKQKLWKLSFAFDAIIV